MYVMSSYIELSVLTSWPKIDSRVRQFLDMEAQVDEEGISDEEDEATERDREGNLFLFLNLITLAPVLTATPRCVH